jgi:hypothetical protein
MSIPDLGAQSSLFIAVSLRKHYETLSWPLLTSSRKDKRGRNNNKEAEDADILFRARPTAKWLC